MSNFQFIIFIAASVAYMAIIGSILHFADALAPKHKPALRDVLHNRCPACKYNCDGLPATAPCPEGNSPRRVRRDIAARHCKLLAFALVAAPATTAFIAPVVDTKLLTIFIIFGLSLFGCILPTLFLLTHAHRWTNTSVHAMSIGHAVGITVATFVTVLTSADHFSILYLPLAQTLASSLACLTGACTARCMR
jgi:hypothetical protein